MKNKIISYYSDDNTWGQNQVNLLCDEGYLIRDVKVDSTSACWYGLYTIVILEKPDVVN